MKKIHFFILALVWIGILTLSACGNESEKDKKTSEPSQESNQQETTAPDSSQDDANVEDTLTKEQAIERATAHLESMDITGARLDEAYLDREDSTQVWSIEFDANGRKYEFYIDIHTGEFLKAPGVTSKLSPGDPPSGWPDDFSISQDRAAEIALELAPGTLIEVDYDFEDRRPVWYVEIHAGQMIHEIYVDVHTGEIVLHESELAD